jgi:RNA polymerase sigma factor (sigma-70 family)
MEERPMTDLQEIVARHGGMVFGVCRRALGNVQEAEDAAQTVFLIFIEKAPPLDRGAALATWLYRTAVYVSSNQIRSRIRREKTLPPPSAPEPETERAWDEAKPHLDDALSRLPGRLQDAIVVHYLQGRTLGETAAALGCPLKTLEKRVGRGLELLRQRLSRAGVAISTAVLVALLQSESKAAAPPALQESLRGRTIPPPRTLFPLKTLILPISAALLVAAFLTGTYRMAGSTGDPGVEKARTAVPTTATIDKAATSTTPPAAATTTPATIQPFPATFDLFATLFRRLTEVPEEIDRWTALGIDLRSDDLRAVIDASSEEPEELVRQGFRRWAGRDPKAAAEWLYRACAILPTALGWKTLRPGIDVEGGGTLLEIAMTTWMKSDPAAAERWMVSLPAGAARDFILADYVQGAGHLPVSSLKELAAMVGLLPPSNSKLQAVASVAAAWGARDPKAAVAWVAGLPRHAGVAPSGESAVFTVYGDDWYLRPFAERCEKDETPEPEHRWANKARIQAVEGLARSWATVDLAAARQWAGNLDDPEERETAMMQVGDVWGESDPAAALAYASAHTKESWQSAWLYTAAKALAEKDLAAALRAADRQEPGARDAVLTAALATWGKSRPEEAAVAALAAAKEATNLDSYTWVLHAIARGWTLKDPRAAAAWSLEAAKILPAAPVFVSVGAAWAESDPAAALEWAQSVPSAGDRTRILSGAAVALAPKDLDLARRVALSLEPGNDKDGTLRSIASIWAKSSPESAMAWCRTLPDSARGVAMLNVLGVWGGKDSAAALAQVDSLPEEFRDQARGWIENGRVTAQRAALRKKLLGEEGK